MSDINIISSSGSLLNLDYRAITGADTVGTSDIASAIRITSGTFTLAFTAVATLGDKAWGIIENKGTGDVTLDPSSSEQIDGVTSWVLYPGGVILWWVDGAANIKTSLLAPMEKVFTSSGNFVVPGCGSFVDDVAWGGGGSGGCRSTTGNATGGGGGSRARGRRNLSDYGVAGATVAVTIGAGGTAITSSNANGNAGGDTTIGALLTARGGGAGSQGGSGASRSGGVGAGLNANATADIGGASSSTSAVVHAGTDFGGAPGGGGATSDVMQAGGDSFDGGAGGGSTANGTVTAGGTARGSGGNGGTGATGSNASPGSQPGGGGGAARSTGNSGKGGDGKAAIRVS